MPFADDKESHIHKFTTAELKATRKLHCWGARRCSRGGAAGAKARDGAPISRVKGKLTFNDYVQVVVMYCMMSKEEILKCACLGRAPQLSLPRRVGGANHHTPRRCAQLRSTHLTSIRLE